MSEPRGALDGMVRVRIPSRSPAVELEGLLHLPSRAGTTAPPPPVGAAVICHPYPPAGGSLGVKLVWAVARHVAAAGMAALRFNFRGVGRSSGRFDGGRGEVDDVGGALDWLAAYDGVDPSRLALVGYSFGALMTLAEAAHDRRPGALVSIGLPLEWSPPSGAAGPPKLPLDDDRPWFLVAGERDPYCPHAALQRLVAGRRAQGGAVELESIPGAGHELAGRERDVGAKVAAFLTRVWGTRR